MVTIDLVGICGWSPTRGRTRLRRGGHVSPNSWMATQLGTPWRGATGPLHLRGCPGAGHHRSFWLSRVVANSRTHPVAAGWTCVAQKFDGHAIWDTIAWCERSIALAWLSWGCLPSISLAFVGGRPLADAPGCGGVDLCRPTVRWPPNWGHHGVVQQVRCTREDALAMVTIALLGICGWSPTRSCPRLKPGGLVSPNSSMATQLRAPWRSERGPFPSRGCPRDGHHRSLWHLRVVANPRMPAVGAGWTCVAQ